MSARRVTAVICNYNKRQDVLRAVRSVLESRDVEIDVLVVDNASTDGSIEALRAEYGDTIRLLAQSENLGGAGGFAAGMVAAQEMPGDYVLLLDNDAVVAPDAAARLAHMLADDPSCGAVAPAICLMSDPQTLQEAGGYIDPVRFTFAPGSAGQAVSSLSDAPFDCDYAAFCAMMTRRQAIREVGPADAGYFIYWDDIDWSARLREAGYRIVVEPGALAWHRGGGVTSSSTVPRYYQWRNRIRFFGTHRTLWDFESFADALGREVVQAISYAHWSGAAELVPALLRALQDAAVDVTGRLTDNVSLPQIEMSKLDRLRERLRLGAPFRLVVHDPEQNGASWERQFDGLLLADSNRTLHVFNHIQNADWSVVKSGDVATDRFLNQFLPLAPPEAARLAADLSTAMPLLRRIHT